MFLFKSRKKVIVRIAAAFMSILLVLCFATGIAVSADTLHAVVSVKDCFTSDNKNIRYVNNLVINGDIIARKNDVMSKIFANDEVAFCIEPNQRISSRDDIESNSSTIWESLTEAEKTALKLALMYGYQGNKGEFTVSDDELYVATQVIVWEIVSGFRSTADNFKCTNNAVIDSFFDADKPLVNAGVKEAYDIIDNYITSYNAMPSFVNEEIEMQWNDIEKYYKAELIDENKVLSQFTVTGNSDAIIFEVENNELTVVTDEENKNIELYFIRKMPTTEGDYTGNFVLWGNTSKQDLVTGLDCKIDMPKGTVKLYTETVIVPTEPITEPITEPVTEPVTEPITEPLTEPVTEPITEPLTEPVTEPITEPLTEPVTEPITEPLTEPVTEPVTELPTETSSEVKTKTVTAVVKDSSTDKVNTSITKSDKSDTATTVYSNNTTGKVATGDSQTTIIVLSFMLVGSAVTIGVANKLRKSNNAQ